MEVSRQNDSVTHVVMGNQESVAMGVSDSAALMHIFSTALYTHPELATVREVICNGWDGHIVVGKQDVPLKINITPEGVLTIQDFGPGIPHDKIGPIYGMFGNSTKRDDSTVTGGFGLGSKAPFAYTDNFEVTSCHDGMKSIYRMSKSSAESMGKPTIDTMVRIPTTESGLTVKIHLKHTAHISTFIRLITEVLVLGEIKAELNGDLIPVLPLDKAPQGYIVTNFKGTLTSKINVRYGNVVYPVPCHAFFGEIWEQIRKGVDTLYDSRIIFMLPPDSVTIAPNREALIFMEATLNTLKNTFSKFGAYSLPKDNSVNRAVKQNMATQLNATIREEGGVESPKDWVKHIQLKDETEMSLRGELQYAYTLRKAVVAYRAAKQDNFVMGNLGHCVVKRLQQTRIAGSVNKELAKKFERAIRRQTAISRGRGQKHQQTRHVNHLDNAFKRHIMLPLKQLIAGSEGLLEWSMVHFPWQRYTNANTEIKQANWKIVNEAVSLVSFLKPRVLLARSQTAIRNYFAGIYHECGGNTDGWIIYQVPKSEKQYSDIENCFSEAGYEVTWYLPARAVAERKDSGALEPKVKKVSPKRKGYLTLTSSFDGDVFSLTHARSTCKPDAHVKDPVAYVDLVKRRSLVDYSVNASHAILKLLGDQIAVVTSVQAAKLKEKGVPSMQEYVTQYADDELVKQKDFPRYLSFSYYLREERGSSQGIDGLILNMCAHKTLMDAVGLRFHVSAHTSLLATLFEDRGYYGPGKKMDKCNELAQKVKASPVLQETRQKIRSSPWGRYLDLDHVATDLKFGLPDSTKVAIPYEIVRKLMQKDSE